METMTERPKPVIIDKKQLSGIWELRKNTSGSNGRKGFGGHMLNAYRHPLTKKLTHLFDVDDQIKNGYMVEKLITRLNPDENPQDKIDLVWLLAHPEVNVEGVKLDGAVRKNSNAPFFLKNLDQQSMTQIDNEDAVDIVIGRLSLNEGPKAVGLERLRYLLAFVNEPYFDVRYVSNPTTEKKILRNKLKNWCRKTDKEGQFNGVKLEPILNEIDNYEMYYLTKEMIRHNLLLLSNGSYKYRNVPVGTDVETCVNFFKRTPTVYTEVQSVLLPLLRQEGFKV